MGASGGGAALGHLNGAPYPETKEFIDALRIKNGNLKIMISNILEDSEL